MRSEAHLLERLYSREEVLRNSEHFFFNGLSRPMFSVISILSFYIMDDVEVIILDEFEKFRNRFSPIVCEKKNSFGHFDYHSCGLPTIEGPKTN